MALKKVEVDTVGGAYLELLADRGVEYLFANSGTDFAPIIEPMCKPGANFPKPITVPHENVAVSMAHGFYMVSGRPQAVMLHVSVGTANGVCAIMNAARSQVPILFTAGRSPITEAGMPGSRDVPIHWPQEMFDQAGMVREFVKWDYELRNGQQLETVVDRALGIAMSEPRGPVYLTLPREVLGESMDGFEFESPSRRREASPPFPDPAMIREAAKILAAARNPLIITTSAGRDGSVVDQLSALAERFAIPVVHKWARTYSLPSSHPMHIGFEPGRYLAEADAILVLESDVPWVPSYQEPSRDCKIIHMASDPLFSRIPIRGYRSDLSITGVLAASLPLLIDSMAEYEEEVATRVLERRQRIEGVRGEQAQARARAIQAARGQAPIHPAWISRCINEVKGEDAIIVKEGPIVLDHLEMSRPNSLFHGHGAGGLGWGLGAALGAKLACPDRLVICVQGDGAYMFGCPVSAHSVGRQYDLPVLNVIFNNSMWGAVRQATLSMYPDGNAARSNREPLVMLEGTPNLERVVEASGGYGERVEDPDELPAALERAMHAVTTERRQAVLNVISQGPAVSFSGSPLQNA